MDMVIEKHTPKCTKMHQNALSAFSGQKIALFKNSHAQMHKMHRAAPRPEHVFLRLNIFELFALLIYTLP